MEVRVTIEVGGEDGSTLLRASRTEPVVTARLSTGEDDYENVVSQFAIASAVLERVSGDTLRTVLEGVEQTTRVIRAEIS